MKLLVFPRCSSFTFSTLYILCLLLITIQASISPPNTNSVSSSSPSNNQVFVKTKTGKSPKVKRSNNGSFLNLFRDCLIRFTFKLDVGKEVMSASMENIERYIKYFDGSTTPIIVENLHVDQNEEKQKQENKSKKPKMWNEVSTAKNAHCTVQMYFIDTDGLLGEKQDFLGLHKIIEGHLLVSKNENPDYIIFVKRNNDKKKESANFKESENGFYSNLYRLALTSKFMVIDGKEKVVKLLCMHCRRDINHENNNDNNEVHKIINPSEITSLTQLDQLWYDTHLNFQSRPVEAFKYQSKKNKGEKEEKDNDETEDQLGKYLKFGCGLYKVGLSTDPITCANLDISQSLNYTPFTTPADYRIYGQIKSGMMSYSEYNEQLFLNPSKASSKYEWLPTAEYFQPFNYITVVSKDGLNISALWRPFASSTWIFLISGFTILTTLFAFTSSSRFEVFKSRYSHLRYALILFTAIILEQSQLTIWKFKLGLNRVSKIILIVWIGFAISMSSLYKGTVFSYLATSVPPPIPETTEALVKSNDYFLITTTSYHVQGKVYSVLDGILNEMMVGQPGKDYPGFYEELKQNVHFVLGSHSDIVQAHKSSSRELLVEDNENQHHHDHHQSGQQEEHGKTKFKEELEVKNSQQIMQKGQHVIHLPDKFAVIGTELDVNTLMGLLETFTTSFVQKSSIVHTFLNRMPWIVRRNFFAKLFQLKLSRLYDSGIYARWRQLNELGSTLDEFKKVQRAIDSKKKTTRMKNGDMNSRTTTTTAMMAKSVREESKNKKANIIANEKDGEFFDHVQYYNSYHYDNRINYNYMALLFSGMKMIKSHHTLSPKPLSFDIFDSAFVFYVMCTTGTCLVFLTEWFIFMLFKFVFNFDRNVVGHMKI